MRDKRAFFPHPSRLELSASPVRTGERGILPGRRIYLQRIPLPPPPPRPPPSLHRVMQNRPPGWRSFRRRHSARRRSLAEDKGKTRRGSAPGRIRATCGFIHAEELARRLRRASARRPPTSFPPSSGTIHGARMNENASAYGEYRTR